MCDEWAGWFDLKLISLAKNNIVIPDSALFSVLVF